MANLPEGVSTLGPVNLPTKEKQEYVKACKEKGELISDNIKKHVRDEVALYNPGFYKEIT